MWNCGNHTLNLAVNQSADTSKQTAMFFGNVQKNFVFLSASTTRWDILKKNLQAAKSLTLKPLCTTRWSGRIDTVKPLHKNPGEIIGALREIENDDSFRPEVQLEAGSVVKKINYAFMCCVCVWFDVLSQTNLASKALQTIQSNIQTAVTCH